MKILSKEFDTLTAPKSGGTYGAASGSGWEQSLYYPGTYYNASYIDVAGLALGEETLFIKSAAVQRGSFNYILPAVAGDRMYVYDVMTSIPIDIKKQTIQDDITNRGLGMPGTTLNFEHVIFSRMQVFSYDVDFANGTAIKVDETQCGSLSPTASDRIYCYRLVGFTTDNNPDGGGVLAPVRHIIELEAKEEPTYEYLMRLKRSYDLQQTPDRD